MVLLIIIFVALVILDVVALRWGFDSRDGICSEEWERRRLLSFPAPHH